MIKIIAKTTVPAENLEAFLALAEPLVRASQAESGNIFYNLHQSEKNPEELVFIEAWENQAAIDAHNTSPHFTGTLPKLFPLCSSEMMIETYQVLL